MTVITLTAAKVAAAHPQHAELYPAIPGEAVTKGLALYRIAATGKYGIADANVSGKQQFRGVAVEAGGADQGISILKRGALFGYDLSGLAYDDPVYLSDTAGAFDTAAGTLSVICGRVIALTDKGIRTKVLYIEADWLRAWA